jgi:hypothetical protein
MGERGAILGLCLCRPILVSRFQEALAVHIRSPKHEPSAKDQQGDKLKEKRINRQLD